MNFVNIGGLLGALGLGALAAAVPLIIHILNRRRFKIVEWAAMRFLLEAQKQNRRKVFLEELLLLLARMLAAALLVWFALRPLLHGEAAGRIVGGRVHHVVILDDSRSMRAIKGGSTLQTQGQSLIAELLDSLKERAPQDLMTVLRTSRPDQPDLLRAAVTIEDLSERLTTLAAGFEPTDGAADLGRALAAAIGTTSSTAETKNRYILISDGSQIDWQDESAAVRAPLLEAARTAAASGELIIVDLAATGSRDNVAITTLEIKDGSVIRGAPITLALTITNHGTREVRDVSVAIGSSKARHALAPIASLAPGAHQIIETSFAFTEPGSDLIEATITPDRFAPDDSALLAVDVIDRLLVLVVDGEPGIGGLDSQSARGGESWFLARALAPGGLIDSGVHVEVATPERFATMDFDNYAALVLANVARIDHSRIEDLENFVKAGGGLLIFAGDQIDQAALDRDLYREGAGPSPGRLIATHGDAGGDLFGSIAPAVTDHPITVLFSGDANPFLDPVKIYAWHEIEAAPDARVLFTSAAGRGGATIGIGTPVAVERSFGLGRVILWGLPADDEWSNWPAEPSYLVTIQEAIRHIAPRTSTLRNLALGDAASRAIDPSEFEIKATLTPPERAARELIAARAADDSLAFDLGNLPRAGAWKLELTRRNAERVIEYTTVQANHAESDQRRLSREALATLLEGIEHTLIENPQELLDAGDGADRAEIWRPLAVLMLIVLLAESFMAMAFGGGLVRRR